MYDSTVKDLHKVRHFILSKHPFYAPIAMKTEIQVGSIYRGCNIETAATDGRVVVFNPDAYDNWTKGQRVTVMFHEYLHIVYGHDLRGIGLDHTLWNIATDHVINNQLTHMKHEPIKDWLCEPKYAGWHEERVYNDIKCEFDSNQKQQDNSSGTSSQQTTSDNKKTDESQASISNNNTSGGGYQGKPDYSQMPEAERVIGDVLDRKNEDGSSMNEEEIERETRELREDLFNSKAIQSQVSGGEGSGFCGTHIVDKIIDPKDEWEVILEQWMGEKGDPSGEYTWESLDRRDLVQDVYSPVEREEGIEWVVAGFDVSGSVCVEERDAFVSHMNKIREGMKIKRMTIIPFSTVVKSHFIKELEEEDEMPEKFPRGGGTRQDYKPTMIIMFTDLGSRHYGSEPDCPVLWASSVPVNAYRDLTPPFGDVVEVEAR